MASPDDLVHAQEMYNLYVEAETAVLKGQAYAIGNRQLTRADLEKIQEGRKYWGNQLQLIGAGGTNRPRVTRVVPI